MCIFHIKLFFIMSALRQRMVEYLRLKNFTPATQRSYISAVKLFAIWFGRSPELSEMEDIRRYRLYLIDRNLSNSTFFSTAQGR